MTDRQKRADEWLNRNYLEWRELELLKLRLEMSESMLSTGVSKFSRSEVQTDHVENVQESKQIEASSLREVVENRIRALDIGDSLTIQAIGHIPSAEVRMVMLRRYIYRYSWKQIANELGYDRRTLFRKRLEGLDTVADFLAVRY